MQPHCQYRHIHLIDDMYSGTLIVQLTLADDAFIHRFSQCVPCTEVFPHTCKTHNLNLWLMLCNCIIERDFLKGLIFIEQVLIVGEIHQFMCLVHHIAQFISEHTTVPECSLRNILLCHIRSRLFPEGLD